MNKPLILKQQQRLSYRLFQARVRWILILSIILNQGNVEASHMAGGDLIYFHQSGDQYRVVYTLYRDCSGIPAPPDLNLNIQSASCSQSISYSLFKVPGTGTEISFPCNSAQTVCSGGSSPGIQEWKYEAVITVPMLCPDWILSVVNCCRNNSINTLTEPEIENIYLEARLNNVQGPNNSPVFNNKPIVFLCANQNTVLNHGVTESDGDSLVYSLIAPQTGPSTHVEFQSPYSGSNPVNSFPLVSINPVNGEIQLHPLQTQVSVMAIKVEEFRSGQLVGSVVRDMQLYVQNCTNNLPVLSGVDGGQNFNSVACPGRPICFDIFSSDTDPGQVITMSWNQGIAGASFSTAGGTHPSGHFCWSPTFADVRTQPYVFTVTVRDNACPMNGVQVFSYRVYVKSLAVTISTSDVQCYRAGNGSASVVITGGDAPYHYAWTPYGGSGSSASGLVGGSYTVNVRDSNGCSISTSLLISEPLPLTLFSDVVNASCQALDGSATIAVNGGVMPYQYQWFPNVGTNATASNLAAGIYAVTVTDANGCTAYTTLQVNGNSLNLSLSSIQHAVCEDGEDGSATIAVSNGQAPFHYNWYPSGGDQAFASHLSPGVYTVTVTDQGTCSAFVNVRIGFDHFLPKAELGVNRKVCKGQTMSLDAGGGFAAYIWSDNSSEQILEVDHSDTYSVMVTDEFGCQNIAAVNVDFIECSGIQDDDQIIFIYPNPTVGFTTVAMDNPEMTSVELFMTDILGQVVWSRTVDQSPSIKEEINMQDLGAGMFFLTVIRGEHHYSGKVIKE